MSNNLFEQKNMELLTMWFTYEVGWKSLNNNLGLSFFYLYYFSSEVYSIISGSSNF